MFLSKLRKKSSGLPAIPAKLPSHMYVALKELGTKEVAGDFSNPRIVEYFTATNYHATDDEVPWCAAFANWVLDKAGISRTRSAAALSFKMWGTAVKGAPELGDVLVWDHGKGRGHVAFFMGFDESGDILAIGGNQDNEVNIGKFDKGSYAYVRRVKKASNSKTIISNAAMASVSTTALTAYILGNNKIETPEVVGTIEPSSSFNEHVATTPIPTTQSLPTVGGNTTTDVIDPEIISLITDMLPPEWGMYISIAVTITVNLFSIYRRFKKLGEVNY